MLQASKFKFFLGGHAPDPPRNSRLWPPEESQPPTIIWADTYLKSS